MNGKRSEQGSHADAGNERGWRFYMWLFFAVLAAIFVLQNTDDTDINFLFAEAQLPLFFALLLAVVLGIAIGWLTPKVRRGQKREAGD